jgi:WD40 repeat protein
MSLAFAPHGRLLASAGGSDLRVRTWNTATWELEHTFSRSRSMHFGTFIQAFTAVAFTPDSKLLAAGGVGDKASWDNLVMVWGTWMGRLKRVLPGYGGSLAFSPTEALLATGAEEVVDATTWERAATLPGARSPVAFSPEGRTLASGAKHNVVLWDTASWKKNGALRGHQGPITSMMFAPDGKCLATSSFDGTARLWSINRGRSVQVLKGHEGCVSAVAFSPDGAIVATGGFDGTVRLWQVKAGRRAQVFSHDSSVRSVAFSPSGAILATGGGDGLIRLWRR